MKNTEEVVRSQAAQALGQSGKSEPTVLRILIASLQDEDSDVRSQAAEALGELGKAELEVNRVLMEVLKDEASYVRDRSGLALCKLFRDKPEQELLSYLQDTRSGWRTIGA